MGCNNLGGITGVGPVIDRKSKMVFNVKSTHRKAGGHGLLKPCQRLALQRHFWTQWWWQWWKIELGWQRGGRVNKTFEDTVFSHYFSVCRGYRTSRTSPQVWNTTTGMRSPLLCADFKFSSTGSQFSISRVPSSGN